MEKKDVIREFCAISSMVMEKVFNYNRAADCFCNTDIFASNFYFDDEVMQYIKTAVEKQIQKDKESKIELNLVRFKEKPYFIRPVKAGEFTVSIQASAHHYCKPRIFKENPNDYIKYEVAIFNRLNEQVNPHVTFPGVDWTNYFENPIYSLFPLTIGACVPKDVVIEIINYLTKNSSQERGENNA